MKLMELGDVPKDLMKTKFKSNWAQPSTDGQHKQEYMSVCMELDETGYIIFLNSGHGKSDQKTGKNSNDL